MRTTLLIGSQGQFRKFYGSEMCNLTLIRPSYHWSWHQTHPCIIKTNLSRGVSDSCSQVIEYHTQQQRSSLRIQTVLFARRHRLQLSNFYIREGYLCDLLGNGANLFDSRQFWFCEYILLLVDDIILDQKSAIFISIRMSLYVF